MGKTRWMIVVGLAILLAATAGCSGQGEPLRFDYDFDEGDHGWTGGFSDLPADYEGDIYELQFALTDAPEELGQDQAFMIAGHNRSDDLFMFLKKGLTTEDGIEPNTTYAIVYEVAFGTNAPAGAVGIGGPPGESVWVKVGAAPIEPIPVEEMEGGRPFYVMNVDKGRQNDDGEHAIRIGNVAKEENEDFETYELKTLDNADMPLEMTSDGDGNLWLFVGTDSGFEGLTRLYYTSISATLTPVR